MLPDMFEASLYAINIPMPETALFTKNEPVAAQLLLVSGICRADFARLNKFYRRRPQPIGERGKFYQKGDFV
jgi:hypothetical protein